MAKGSQMSPDPLGTPVCCLLLETLGKASGHWNALPWGPLLTLSLCHLTFAASTSVWLSRCQVSEMIWPMKLFEEWSSSLTGGKEKKCPPRADSSGERDIFWTQVKSVAESVSLNSVLPLVDKGLPYILNTSYVTKTVLFYFLTRFWGLRGNTPACSLPALPMKSYLFNSWNWHYL